MVGLRVLFQFCWSVPLLSGNQSLHGFGASDSQMYRPIIFWGAEPSMPEKFFSSDEKTAMLTCKLTLPDSPYPVIISKNPRFWALISLDRMNSIFFI